MLTSNVWTLKADLAGFIALPYAHTGQRLGQALFKVLARLGIERQVCYLHCRYKFIETNPSSVLYNEGGLGYIR